MDRIRIQFGERELGHSTAYDALAGDLHEQGWKMVTIEPSEDVEGYSVVVYLSQDVADGVLGAIVAAITERLGRVRERWDDRIREAVIYGPSGETLDVVSLDEEERLVPGH
jgi:hypothetical protein